MKAKRIKCSECKKYIAEKNIFELTHNGPIRKICVKCAERYI